MSLWVHMVSLLFEIEKKLKGDDGVVREGEMEDCVVAAIMPFIIYFSTAAMRRGELYGLKVSRLQ